MKIVKRLAIILSITVLVVIVTSIGFATKYEDKIIRLVIGEINQQIDTEIQIESVNFSMIKKFPLASIDFKNVFIKSGKSFPKQTSQDDTLAYVQHLFLQLDLSDLIQKKYNLKQIELKNGTVWMQQNKKDNINYKVTKNQSENNSSNFNIDLQKISLKNIEYRYINQKSNSEYSFYTDEYTIVGKFSEKKFTITTKGDLLINRLKQNNIDYLVYPNTRINTNLKVSNNQVNITSGKLWMGKETLEVTGFYNWEKQGKFKIVAQSKKLGIQNLIKHLPNKLTEEWTKKYDAKGTMAFVMNISQDIAKEKKPKLTIQSNISNAKVRKKPENITLDNIQMSLNFDDSNKRLNIKQFDGKLNKNWITGSAKIKLLKTPYIQTQFIIESDLTELQSFLDFGFIENINGFIRANITAFGKLGDLQSLSKKSINQISLDGEVDIEQTNILFNDKNKNAISNLDAKIYLQNKHLQVKNITLRYNDIKTQFSGRVYNLIPYILFDDEELRLNGNLSCDSININDFTSKEENNNIKAFEFPKRLVARLNMEIKQVSKDKFTASDIKTGLYINDTCLQVAPFKTNIAEGSATGRVFLTKLSEGNFTLDVQSTTKNINISKLMYQFDNFGQNSLKHSQISGEITANTSLIANLNPQLKFDIPSILVDSDLKLYNGKLDHYEPLYKLSRFISLEELEEINFQTLTSKINIKNNTIYIPKTKIHSNALNLSLSGEHQINSNYTYHLNILLSELLGRKARKSKAENETFGFIEDDGYGRTSLFIKIEGNNDDIHFKYDSKSTREHLKEEFKEEKKNLKSILKEEFGLYKKDSSVVTPKTKKKKTKEQFKIQWDD